MRFSCVELIAIFFAIGMTPTVFGKALGGNEVGNGGNAVVCEKTGRAEMLDLYEAHVLRGASLDPTLQNLLGTDPYTIAKSRLDLVDKADSKSAKIYFIGVDRFKKDAFFDEQINLQPIDDSQHVFVPSDPTCKVTRLAVLRKKPLPGERRILIDGKVWKKMDSIQQAALILHEVIYERLAGLGEEDSTKARYMVSYLMSSNARTDSVDVYWQLVKKLRLPIYY